VCDETDNCVKDVNPDQSDADQDGVGDVCDNCPKDENKDQVTRTATASATRARS
jgi:hypothetical protein